VSDPIAFVDLAAQRRRLGAAVDDAVAGVLEHGRYILGPEVRELEGELARRAQVESAVACASGTDALLLPLMAAGVGPGDAVVLPSFTFPATPEVVNLIGATVVFVDVDPHTFNLSTDQIGQAAKVARVAGFEPRVVIGVDLFGQPCDYEQLDDAARDEGLWVIADAAQSFGASYQEAPVGSWGRCAATSFFPAKPLGCYGDGGAVITGDADLAELMRSIGQHGKGSDRYDTVRIGLNSRLDTIQAAVLLAKLSIFDDECARRQDVADRYIENLADVVTVPRLAPDRTSVWAQFTIQVDGRDEVRSRLDADGIPTAVYYPRPLHQQPAYAETSLRVGELPNAERLSQVVLSLPMHPYLDEATQDRIVESVRRAVD
jgi:dTDP-4-amino-4,6-dideoxygalactose transaminase